jgi:hypothetical protein
MKHLNEDIDRAKQLMGLLMEQYGGGKIKEGDVPCDIWCKRKTAKLGSRGDVVKMIQNVLAGGCGEYGPYNSEKLGGGLNDGCAENWTNCDGKFGPETEKAVEEFQGEGGLTLTVDGKVGFNTLSALCKVCYGTGSPKDSAEYILCQKQCQCDDKSSDDQSSDGIQDVLDKIGDVDIDDWDDDIYGVDGPSCNRIKACLYYANHNFLELPNWSHFIECLRGDFSSDRTTDV